MKKKIKLLSKGIFEYENPEIEFSVERIELEVEYGSQYSGFFDVRSLNHVEIRAMVFSSNKWMQCLETSVIGESARVHFCFETKALEIGEDCEGAFSLVSNGGELVLPYCVHICAPYCETSMGQINEIDQFVALAEYDWSEAQRIFHSTDFERIFLNNKKNNRIYQVLKKNADPSLAVEEFLCTIRRKQPVQISVSQELIEYANLNQSISDKLVIEKNQWGHVGFHVRTEGDFITIYKRLVTTEDFLGSYYQLEYQIAPRKLSKVQGNIILESFNQRIIIPVLCTQEKMQREAARERRTLKKSLLELNRKYVAYRLGELSKADWMAESREAIDGCLNNSKDASYKVVEAAFLLESGDVKAASELIDNINGRELLHHSTISYCFYLYVSAKCRNEQSYTDYVINSIRYHTEGPYKDAWQLRMMLVKLDNRAKPERIYKEMRELYSHRIPGAVLYAETIRLINEQPSLLREIGSFEINLFIWGARHDCLEREVIYQFADLMIKVRSAHEQCLQALMGLCDIYETKNLLAAVLHQLILGDYKDKKYNKWYLLGIRSSLKIQNLYEYYMATLDTGEKTVLPTSVLIYFQYDNRLSIVQKAYLYHYVIDHKDELERIFRTYDGIIKAFTFDQLKKGSMNADLAVLYNYYLTQETPAAHVLKALPTVIFKQRIHLNYDYPGIQGIIVDYSEIEKETYYPMQGLDAYIDIYVDAYQILFVTGDGGRYMASVDYTIEKMMDSGHFIKECYEQCQDQQMILLNRSERALKYQMMDDISIEVYKRTLRLGDVSRHYQKTILKNLIDYYDDNYEGETLEKYLLQIDIALLGHEERSHIIEYFIQRGLYEKAYAAIGEYGYEGIKDKRIMRLCSRIIREMNYEKEPMLIEMAHHSFANGKYDEVILQYLIRFYMSTTKNLYAVWQAAIDFEVPAVELEERILCEVMFSEIPAASYCNVFKTYYGAHPTEQLVKAFLAYSAYQFVTKDVKVTQQVFHVMEIELDQMADARDICSMALLKYYAQASDLEPAYANWISREVSGFMEKGILMPFFKRFAGFGEVPRELVDLTYVTWQTKPSQQVTIHYRHTKEETGWHHDAMKHIFGGIFMKALRIFENDELVYYITETDGSHEVKTEENILRAEKCGENQLADGIDQLNRMEDYLAFHDEPALHKALIAYDRLETMIDQLFPMR